MSVRYAISFWCMESHIFKCAKWWTFPWQYRICWVKLTCGSIQHARIIFCSAGYRIWGGVGKHCKRRDRTFVVGISIWFIDTRAACVLTKNVRRRWQWFVMILLISCRSFGIAAFVSKTRRGKHSSLCWCNHGWYGTTSYRQSNVNQMWFKSCLLTMLHLI